MTTHRFDISDDIDTNPTDNPAFADVLDTHLSRRRVLQVGGIGAAVAFVGGVGLADRVAALGGATTVAATSTSALLGFTSVPLTNTDTLDVPPGYTASVLFAWGDPVSNGPAFAMDASQTWVEQEQQSGMHHDGIHYFPLPGVDGRPSSSRGLLAINHEYVDPGLLYPDGLATWNLDKVRKALAAHGVSVIEVARDAGTGDWSVVRPSGYARRITGTTPMTFVGPAAGSPLLQTAADPTGRAVLGTLNNCGSGLTPWGTFVTCEENFNGYFGWDGSYTRNAAETRYGISQNGFGYRWHEVDPRFNVRLNPNEANRFGWAVEIDPRKPGSTPKKLTALGRFKHEAVVMRFSSDNRVVVYSGDDERNNYIYKFVGAQRYTDALRAKKSPLEEGTLYVAAFEPGATAGDMQGTGRWIPLTTDNPALAGWTIDQILVNTRLAADAVGATRMDRPEWGAIGRGGEVYFTLTNNSARTTPDESNPRVATGKGNQYGHIIRWREDGGDQAALTFTWDIFTLAGDPSNPAALNGTDPGGNVIGDMFGSPDGLWIDPDNRVWIQTDISSSTLGAGSYANIPRNMMLAADPKTREVKRFLVGPRSCEVTGVHTTPDRRTMFVDIQHPGESPSEISDPANPRALSNWPDFDPSGRPRSATVVITKDDGGVIGT